MVEAVVWYSPEQEEDRFLPEGPRLLHWQGREAILWVNIQTGIDSETGALLLRFWDTGEVRRFPLPGRPGFVVPLAEDGQVLVGLTKAIGLYDLNSQQFTSLARIPDDNPRTIINDGEPVPNSTAVLFGTKDTKFADRIAALYLFQRDPEPRIVLLRSDQLCSNGKVIHDTPAGLIVYDIDTPSKLITRNRLDLEAGMLTQLGIAVDLRSEPDFPDGMVDGGANTVIVAFYNPAAVPAGRAVRYSLATGQALESWSLPGAPRVTCPLRISRPDGEKLLFTTATEGMSDELRRFCPHSGSLFLADFPRAN